jgi:hypothetical protein
MRPWRSIRRRSGASSSNDDAPYCPFCVNGLFLLPVIDQADCAQMNETNRGEPLPASQQPRRTRLLRVAEHVRAQNWAAIGIDFLIVVLGVFVGLQVANWNDDRKTQQREAELIERLHGDFAAINTRLLEAHAKWRQNLTSANQLLSDLDALRRDGQWPRDKPAMLFDLNNVTSHRSPTPRAATYVEMVSAGQLGVIRDARLRDALREYDTRAQTVATLNAHLQQRVEPFRTNVIAHLEFDAGLTIESLAALPQHDVIRADYFNDVDLDALAGDPSMRTALTVLASTFLDQQTLVFRTQQDAGAVLALLAARDGENRAIAP